MLIIIAILYFLFQNGTLDQVKTDSTSISQVTCDDLKGVAEGHSLQNAFGAQFEVIKVYNLNEHSRTNTAVRCTGTARFSDASTKNITIRAFDDGDDRMYEFSAE